MRQPEKEQEILRLEPNAVQRKFGSHHNSCPDSPVYRKFSVRLSADQQQHLEPGCL